MRKKKKEGMKLNKKKQKKNRIDPNEQIDRYE